MATQSYRERMKAARAQASAQRKAEKVEYRILTKSFLEILL